MNTTAHAVISLDRTIVNLTLALEELDRKLRSEGRYVSSEHVGIAKASLRYAGDRLGYRTPGHD